ncbi:MAG: TolC family protein [Gammaproteobacteria bacterium]|nr:TolC family protein [Gammaproteobacteria bacterium]
MFLLSMGGLRARDAAAHRAASWARVCLMICPFALSASTFASEPLTLERAVSLAEQTAPMLSAARSASLAAERRIGPAGELPDPELIAGIDNLPASGPDAGSFSADFMTMRKVGVMQRFVRREKRSLRQQFAAAEAERESATLTSAQLSLRTAVAQAWIETSLAERRLLLLESLRSRFDLAVTAAEARLVSGDGSGAEVLSAKEARVMLEDRLSEAARDSRIARAELARWLPKDADRALGVPPDWRDLEASGAGAWLSRVDHHRDLLDYAARVHAAEVDLRLAKAEKRPDWSLELAYADRGPAFSNMLSLMVRVDLPVFSARRQDPLIAAKEAERDRIEAEREDMRRSHRADLQRVVETWNTAKEQSDRFDRQLRPLARDRSDVALAAYGGGRGNLDGAIAALSAETEREIEYVDRLRVMALAWAELRYGFAEEH